MMTDELKPVRCGCGGEAEIDWVLQPDGVYMTGVYCENCGTKTIPFWSMEKNKAIDYAVTTWNRAMGAVKLEHTYQVGEDWYCENCGQQLNAYSWETPQNLAELRNENAQVSEVTSQNDKGTSQKTERTAKVIEHDASVTDTDGNKYHRSEYLCGACKKKVLGGDDYCSHCGAKLIWVDDEDIPMEYFESGGR